MILIRYSLLLYDLKELFAESRTCGWPKKSSNHAGIRFGQAAGKAEVSIDHQMGKRRDDVFTGIYPVLSVGILCFPYTVCELLSISLYFG